MHHLVGFIFAEGEIALEDALGAVDGLSRLKPVGQLRVLRFQTGTLDLSSDKIAQRGKQAHFVRAVLVREPVLQIDNADDPVCADDWTA